MISHAHDGDRGVLSYRTLAAAARRSDRIPTCLFVKREGRRSGSVGNNSERSYRLWEIVKPTVFPIPADPSTLGGIPEFSLYPRIWDIDLQNRSNHDSHKTCLV